MEKYKFVVKKIIDVFNQDKYMVYIYDMNDELLGVKEFKSGINCKAWVENIDKHLTEPRKETIQKGIITIKEPKPF